MKDEEKPQRINPLKAIQEEKKEKAKARKLGVNVEELEFHEKKLQQEKVTTKKAEEKQRLADREAAIAARIATEKEINDKSVHVKSFDMPFEGMVIFMLKWAAASIPAFIILFFFFAVFFAIFGSLFF